MLNKPAKYKFSRLFYPLFLSVSLIGGSVLAMDTPEDPYKTGGYATARIPSGASKTSVTYPCPEPEDIVWTYDAKNSSPVFQVFQWRGSVGDSPWRVTSSAFTRSEHDTPELEFESTLRPVQQMRLTDYRWKWGVECQYKVTNSSRGTGIVRVSQPVEGFQCISQEEGSGKDKKGKFVCTNLCVPNRDN
jgi:hypothetical protein